MKLEAGFTIEQHFTFTQEDVNKFIDVTHDDNPVHHDEDYAATTMFKKPIMHGFLSGTIFSRIFGTMEPGIGTIYMSQSMRFLKPMYVEEIYKGVVVLEEVNTEKHRGKFSTKVFDQKGDLTLEGEALLYHREKF